MDEEKQVTVETLLAVAGGEKTRTKAKEAADNIGHSRSVFAVRTIENAALLEVTIRERMRNSLSPYNPDRCIRNINNKDGVTGKVRHKLETALRDDGIWIVIITHQTLADFTKWNVYGVKRTLYIDELPAAIEMASATFTNAELAAIDSSLTLNDYERLKTDPTQLQAGAARLHAEDLAEESVWSTEASKLWRVMSQADMRCISVQIQAKKERLKISVIKESAIFDHLRSFDKIRLATMLFEGSLFQTIGKAKGITFKDYNWPNQHKPFKYDKWVTLYPMAESESMASRGQLEEKDAEDTNLFKRIVKKVLTIPVFKDSRFKILLYVNKDKSKVQRETALRSMNIADRFDLMPFDCHGKHKWQKEGRTKFALFLTSRWNPNFNECGKCFAEKLGISFENLKNAYEVSQMLEPTAQAATRGVVRSDNPEGPNSHIAVIDQHIAGWLKNNVFPNATICTKYMLKSEKVVKISSLAGWRGTMAKTYGYDGSKARWVDRNIRKMEAHYGMVLDHMKSEHRELVRVYTEEFRKERTRKAA